MRGSAVPRDLSSAELLCCVRACAALRLPPAVGPYFREFLARRIEGDWPNLAAKVREYADADLAALYDHVRRRQQDQR
jgi:hypothetical protein